jgi:hypothetical protein
VKPRPSGTVSESQRSGPITRNCDALSPHGREFRPTLKPIYTEMFTCARGIGQNSISSRTSRPR